MARKKTEEELDAEVLVEDPDVAVAEPETVPARAETLAEKHERALKIIQQYRKDLQYITSSRADDYAARRLQELANEMKGLFE